MTASGSAEARPPDAEAGSLIQTRLDSYLSEDDDEQENFDDSGLPVKYVRRRRAGVSAESVSEPQILSFTPPVYPKNESDRSFLREIFDSDKLSMLVGHLDSERKSSVVDAMFTMKVEAGTVLIRQGGHGDFFYIVAHGRFDILVDRGRGEGQQKVMEAGPSSTFGELALMYNAPRAATVVATEASAVWALDRSAFKMMIVTSENIKKRRYEEFLEGVDIFKALNQYERSQLSDLLCGTTFTDGEYIIRQGDLGDRFFIVESGVGICLMGVPPAPEIEVLRYSTGMYFGELALIGESRARKASVRACGECNVLWIDKATFDRVLGPIVDVLRTHAGAYPSYGELLRAAGCEGPPL